MRALVSSVVLTVFGIVLSISVLVSFNLLELPETHPCTTLGPEFIEKNTFLVQDVAPIDRSSQRMTIRDRCSSRGYYSFMVELNFTTATPPLQACKHIEDSLKRNPEWADAEPFTLIPDHPLPCIIGYEGPTGPFSAEIDSSGIGHIGVNLSYKGY